jgi:hypothetical protein
MDCEEMKQNLLEYQFAPPVLGRKTPRGQPAEYRRDASTRRLNVKEEFSTVLCRWPLPVLHKNRDAASGRKAKENHGHRGAVE